VKTHFGDAASGMASEDDARGMQVDRSGTHAWTWATMHVAGPWVPLPERSRHIAPAAALDAKLCGVCRESGVESARTIEFA
jgi:hypothetical protein